MDKQPSVYILTNKPLGTLYIGVTSHLAKRIWEHREGVVDGFTKRHQLHHLVYFEQHETMIAAISREKQLKKWKRSWKIALIESKNPHWTDCWRDIT